MRRFLICVSSGMLCLAADAAAMEPPSDVEVFNCIRTIQMRYAELEERDFHEAKRQFRGMIRDVTAALDIAQLTPYQVSLIGPLLDDALLEGEAKAAFVTALETAADDPKHGAAALLLLHSILFWETPDKAYLIRFLKHPGMAATMNTWFGGKAINAFALEPDLMRAHLPQIEAAVLAMHPDGAYRLGRPSVARLLEALDHPDIMDQTRQARNRIHAHLLKVARSRLAKFAPTGGSSFAPAKERIASAIDLVEYLEGPASRSQLLGHEAPALQFEWSRGPHAPFENLEQLRGKVVVLDFWATWCGPCVASFDTLRDLQEAYHESDVVIIGVTSIQGAHVPINGAAIDLKDDPGRERQLMGAYMNENDITWNIAFSTRPVTEPRYDVWGIPHLTIIDRSGIVRHNNLHPDSARLEGLRALIDPLLAESGDGASTPGGE